MILASALQFEYNGKTITLCGCRHGDIYNQLISLGISIDNICDAREGFITHKNEFLNRQEAYIHAEICGQLSNFVKTNKFNKSLISEDLW